MFSHCGYGDMWSKRGLTLHSWNVNGLRAVLKKGFCRYLDHYHPDILCLQETKLSTEALREKGFDFGYPYFYYHCADKKGYSGTAVLTRNRPLNVVYDLPDMGDGRSRKHPREGRIITLEYESFFLVNVYTPNAKAQLTRLAYRYNEWEPDYRSYLQSLRQSKPVIACGDFNVAHREIDLSRPEANRRNPGFTDEERERFTELLGSGFVDSYRHQYPHQTGAYTWWSYRTKARERNIGWRIDYFLFSDALVPHFKEAAIHADVRGSDHCPISLRLCL